MTAFERVKQNAPVRHRVAELVTSFGETAVAAYEALPETSQMKVIDSLAAARDAVTAGKAAIVGYDRCILALTTAGDFVWPTDAEGPCRAADAQLDQAIVAKRTAFLQLANTKLPANRLGDLQAADRTFEDTWSVGLDSTGTLLSQIDCAR